MNRYPVWKYVTMLVVLLLGIVYALPNYFGGLDIHFWIYFNNAEQKLACNSPYLGLITLI